MELIAILSNRDEIVSAVRNCLKGYNFYPVNTVAELEELLINIPAGLLILDVFAIKPHQVEELMSMNKLAIILLTNDGFNLSKLSNIPETVEDYNILKALPKAVESLFEKKRLENEIKTLTKSRFMEEQALNGFDFPQVIDSPVKRLMHEHILLNFAKTLTVNFDKKKLLSHFMDSVMEIIRVNKMSIMLREKNVFKIKSHIGMDPFYSENLKLTNESPLIKWLAGHGRVLYRSLNAQNQVSTVILKEMGMLQCVFSFPMIYRGKLAGVFNIDSKITGDPFYKEEIEVIFMLCNYLSAAIKDIDSYHQIQCQKEFTKNILSNMNSGVITINTDERISMFNQRASEILKLDSVDIIGSDLRQLPSPLGDILYETMVTEKSYNRHEITIKPGNIPLGINSYRLLTDNKPIGAVVVFTDLSDLKRLAEERRRAEKLEAINNLIGNIAHEIKNPLTSIQTFTQLLNDKYNDEEFRKFFSFTVMQSVQQLNNLVDKLVIFSSPLDYHPEIHNVNEIIDEAISFAWKDMPSGIRLMKENLNNDVYINVDINLLVKAIYYLILTSAERSLKDDFILVHAVMNDDKPDSVRISIKFSGNLLSQEEKESILRPLLDMDTFGIELNVPISQKIIEDQNGTLAIESSDEGNALIITFPAVPQAFGVRKDNINE